MRYDLHNHTKYSDGVYTPVELVDAAIKENVWAFALTDHDTVDGIPETMAYAKTKGVRLIPGMELSTTYKGCSVHIVCLFKNGIIPEVIFEYQKDMCERRKVRAIKMMENIRDIYGLKINLQTLIESSEVITRGNMLRNICENNSLSFAEARKYISEDSKAYIQASKMSVNEGLALIRRANGVAILAHPGLIKREYLLDILDYGFDGIEAKYPLHSPEDERYFTQLAKEYNLVISAGSDCHGDASHSPIGTSTLDEEEFASIERLLKE